MDSGVLVVTSVRDITERRRTEELLWAQEQRAVFGERERIARELHDGAIQALFAVGMGLQSMATMIQDRALRARLDAMVGRIDDVIRDLRNYIFGLCPGLAADRQLSLVLCELAEQFEQQYGVVCPVDVDERRPGTGAARRRAPPAPGGRHPSASSGPRPGSPARGGVAGPGRPSRHAASARTARRR